MRKIALTAIAIIAATLLIDYSTLSPFYVSGSVTYSILLTMLISFVPILLTVAAVDQAVVTLLGQPRHLYEGAASGLLLVYLFVWLNRLADGPYLVNWPDYTGFALIVLSGIVGYWLGRFALQTIASGVGVLLLVALLSMRLSFGGQRSQQQNVLLVIVDAVHAQYIDYSKPGLMPNLTTFANRDGVTRFERAYATSSWSLPSVVSMNTGLHTPEHRVDAMSKGLVDDAMTAAERLRNNDYNTGGVSANRFFGPAHNTDQGFERFVNIIKPDRRQFIDRIMDAVPWWSFDRQINRSGADVNEAVLTMMDRIGRPFFIESFYIDPHAPYNSHGRDCPEPGVTDDGDLGSGMRCRYRAELQYWDRMFGQLMNSVMNRGLLENTTIIVTSDHGEAFKQDGAYGHKSTLSPTQTHVPLLVYQPGASGGVVEQPVSTLSIHDTVLSAANKNRATSLLSDNGDYETPIVMSLRTDDGMHYGLIDGNYQFVTTPDGNDLYQLNGKRTSVDKPAVREKLDNRLHGLIDEYSQKPNLSKGIQLGRQERSVLKGLGYM